MQLPRLDIVERSERQPANQVQALLKVILTDELETASTDSEAPLVPIYS